jgi:class 3 adenylate cyclase
VAGVAYAFSGFTFIRGNMHYAEVYHLLPGLLWGSELLVRGAVRGGLLVLALAVAMSILAGMPEATLLVFLYAAAYGAFRTVWSSLQERSWRVFGLRTDGLAAAWIVGIGLSAPMLGPLLEQLLRIHLRQAVSAEIVSAAERQAGTLPGAREIGVGFLDLVGFTRLGESLDVTEIGSLAERLEDMATAVARPPVRLIKTIGDAAMLVSSDARAGVQAALDLVAEGEADTDFPRLRAGMAHGPALARLGDWYGRPVNLASRITTVARPGSVLATREVRDAATDGYRWSRAPSRRFKGVEEPVRLYRVRPAGG